MCDKNAIVFIDNGNISNMDLYQDDLHLLERGKCLLAKNFIFVLNVSLNMQTLPSNRNKALLDCSGVKDSQISRDLRLQQKKSSFWLSEYQWPKNQNK